MSEIDLVRFNKLKQKTEEDYKEIGTIFSPALKSAINFTSEGFYHLRYSSNRSERTRSVQQNKFRFFNQAVDIIKKATTIQEYRRSICPVGKPDHSGFRKTGIVHWFGFFAITNFSNSTRIMVVVRKVGEGQYHFWSVMPYWSLSNKNRVIGSDKIKDE